MNLAVLSFVFYILVSHFVMIVEAQTGTNLNSAIRLLKEWQSGFSSIHVQYRYATPNHHAADFPGLSDEEIGRRFFIEGNWYWNDSGNTRSEFVLWREGRPDSRVVEATNSARNQAFKADYSIDSEGNETLKTIWLYAQATSSPRSTVVIHPIYPLWDKQDGIWLGDKLRALNENGTAKVEASEKFVVYFETRELELDLRACGKNYTGLSFLNAIMLQAITTKDS
jgi:hypothetical protein